VLTDSAALLLAAVACFVNEFLNEFPRVGARRRQ